MKVYGKSHVGKLRKNNEDNFVVVTEKTGTLQNVFGVADGMGGHNAGEVASMECIDSYLNYIVNTKEEKDTLVLIKEAINYANEKVFEKSLENSDLFGMGTTFSVLTINENIVYCGHVGDSRIYTYKNGVLSMESTDHTLVNEYLNQGIMTEEEAKVSKVKNVITRAIGIREELAIDTFAFNANEGDYILICSDGLNTHLSNEDITNVFEQGLDIEETVDLLIDNTLACGGTDNITVVIIQL